MASGMPGQRRLEYYKWFLLAAVAVSAFGPFYILQPLPELDPAGHWALSCVVFALAAWMVYPARLPRGVAGLFMMGLMLIGELPYGDVFAGFTSSAVWIIIPAFLFGYVIQETGLGIRLTALVLNRFRGNITRTAFGLMLIGILFSMLTPSITVRIAIIMPIVLGIIRALQLPGRSREAAFISLVAYTAILIPGNGWLTGSLVGPINIGLLSPELRAGLDWFNYTRALILPWGVVTVLMLGYLFIVFRPRQVSESGAATYEGIQPGEISRAEISGGLILALCFLGYLTTPLHGLESVTITALAVFLLFFSGTLTVQAISDGVSWDVVLFIGSIMSIPTVLEKVGFISMLTGALKPLISGAAAQIHLFTFSMLLLVFLVRFFDVAWGLPSLTLLMAFAPSLYLLGVHPVVLCFLSGVIQCFTILHYMSPFAIISSNILEHQGWSERHLVLYGLGFIISVSLGVLPAIWYWQLLGLL